MNKAGKIPYQEDIFLICGSLQNEPTWYYVRVEKRRQPLLYKAAMKNSLNPADLGTILFQGSGIQPPLYYREKVARGDFC